MSTAALPASALHFCFAWLLPLSVAAAAWRSPALAAGLMFTWQVGLALAEHVPRWRQALAPVPLPGAGYIAVLRVHVLLQAALLAIAVAVVLREGSVMAALLLGLAVGSIAGGQGITFAHELGHSRSRLDRLLGWLLMGSVGYAHFMVEHYRGHHVRAATAADPASARRGESLWRFLPRTLAGSLTSAWRLESLQLRQRRRGWLRSPLAWASVAQVAWLVLLFAAFGPLVLLFWLVMSAYAIFLLETINYIEHYGLQRRCVGGRHEPFGLGHAWNADHCVTNLVLANLQRHSDHHMHAWKPYAALAPLPGPQLPTGYAGCLFLASLPWLWFRVMHPRLAALPAA